MSVVVRQHAQSLVQEYSSGKSHVTTTEEDEVNRCLVFCRIRPATAKDYEDGAHQLVSMTGKRVIVKDERHYDFDGTFDQQCKQEDIFVQVAIPCINHAFKGFCSALMCYGQTGTGKSFTMCCTKPGLEGVIPRSAKYLFERIQGDPSRKYVVQGQFIQIYRDQLGDLMSTTGRDKVDIRCEATDGVSLPGCSSHELRSEKEFMQFYEEGNQRRVVTATAMNPESSRGHTAMVIWVMSEPADDPCGGKHRGKITFIDLAGYERFSKTGISNSNATMKDEAKTINASLLSLGHVVTSLSNGDKHIPWRNAKLTRLLQDSIGGRSRTSIILTIGPSSDHLHETTNSLQFGLRAMAVKVEAKVSVTIDYEKLAAKLQLMLDEKNERINDLEIQIAARDAERAELQERHLRDISDLQARKEADIAALIKEGASPSQIENLAEVYRVEAENLQEQQREEVQIQEEVYNKEIVNLVSEQQRQEARKQVEIKLVQERLIEEFQAKLDSARGGTNDDLIKAIQQLSDKDALIASRANDTARLHEHIEALTQQIRDMGAQPIHEAKFPETFLDISQIDELQNNLSGEVERQHQKIVELKAQLERLTQVCNERLEDVEEYRLQNIRLKEELCNAGVNAQETALELAKAAESRSRLIDPIELETVRVSMQADIDELKSHNDTLQEEVSKLKEQLKEQQSTVPLTGRVRSLSITSRGRPMGLGGGSGFGGASGSVGADNARADMLQQYKDQIASLEQTVMEGNRERNTLCQRIAELSNQLEEQGITVDDDDCISAPPNRDMEALLNSKENEVKAVLSLAEKLEQSLHSERATRLFTQSVNERLQDKLRQAQISADTLEGMTPPPTTQSTVSVDVYHDLLRRIRELNSKIMQRLLVRSFDEDPDGIEPIIQELQDELQMRDEMILHHATEQKGLITLADQLEKQLRKASLEPVCSLSVDHRATLVETEHEMEDIKHRHQVLEEDKRRLQQVLETLKADRASTSHDKQKLEQDLNDAKRKAKELEEQRQQQLEREHVLQEQTRLATRQMMDAQAKIAMAEGQGSIIARIKRLLN